MRRKIRETIAQNEALCESWTKDGLKFKVENICRDTIFETVNSIRLDEIRMGNRRTLAVVISFRYRPRRSIERRCRHRIRRLLKETNGLLRVMAFSDWGGSRVELHDSSSSVDALDTKILNEEDSEEGSEEDSEGDNKKNREENSEEDEEIEGDKESDGGVELE